MIRLRRTLVRELSQLRAGGREALLWSLRVTVAATASYVVGRLLFPDTQPLLAPLTAMLVVQVTPVSLLSSGLDRVIAVVSGVTLAVAFGAVVPLRWWSLGLLIFVAITLGQALRLKSNRVEVAISGMLVLGVGALGTGSAAWERIAETLVGAAAAITANLLFPPKVASNDVGDAIDRLADRVGELLTSSADELSELIANDRPIAPAARLWLDEAREITADIPEIQQALAQAEEGRRLNVRAVGTADVGPGLRQGLESLEHSAVAIRSMYRAVLDATRDTTWLASAELATDEVFLGIAHTFRELAAGVDAFGQLVHDEGDPTVRGVGASDAQALRHGLDGMHEARNRLETQLVAGGPSELLELNAAVLGTVKRTLREMDLDERVRRQLRLARRPSRSGDPTIDAPAATPPRTDPDPDAETQRLQLPTTRSKRRP
ncbi:MAG: FUSC family protein [Nocardioides sp.]